MALWIVKIGHGGTQRTQSRVTSVIVDEEFAMKKFTVTIKTPIASERTQAKGRINNALIQIICGSTTLLDGFIEDVESGADYVKYTGRSFIVALGYSPNSDTDSSSPYNTKAEYSGDTGAVICNDLIDEFCHHVDGSATVRDSTLTYSDITFTEEFDGEVKIHGAQKVYDVIKNMVQMYGKDVWADATWAGTTLTNKNIHIGDRSRGNAGAPHKTLTGGVNIADIPVVKYRSSQAINCLRVLGKGSGKEQVSVWVEDATSIAAIGYVEGAPYQSNLIVSKDTAEAIGNAIITAKKDPIVELKVTPVIYINDLRYGDWVRIIDSYSGVDTTKRIKRISYIYTANNIDSMRIDLGDKFDNYENIIRDLTKGDVNEEPEMVKLGGALRITANNPPSDYVRHDPGDYYDTTGTFQHKGKGVSTFWAADVRRLGGLNPTNGNFKKALIMIKDSDQTVWHRVGTEYGTYAGAEGDSISVDATYTPLGEVILRGKGSDEVEDVYASYESGKSYIYRDVRPIVGSSSTGFGGDVSNPMTEDLAAGGYKITGLGAATVSGDAISLDGDGYVPIAKLPLGATGVKGDLLVGKETGCEELLVGADTYVLTADSTEAFGIKWAAPSAGMWEVSGAYARLIVAKPIDLREQNLDNVGERIQFDTSQTYSKIQFHGTADALHYTHTEAPDPVVDRWDFFINNVSRLQVAVDAIDAWVPLDMNSNKITGLPAGTVNGDSIRYDEYSVHTHDGRYYTETEIDTWRNSTTQTEMGYLNEVSSSIQDQLNARLPLAAGSGNPLSGDLYMGNNDIIDCKDIKGDTSGTDGADRLNLDFRGDANHRIYYTGTADNRLGYKTYNAHAFSIQATVIAQIDANGLHMQTGKYIKSSSGDLELRAPSGSKIKFVIG